MTKKKEVITLESSILMLQKEAKDQPLTISEILRILSGRGRPLVLLLLSLPFCQPIQIPGLSTPFGLAIAFIGLRLVFGKRIWMPKKILSITVSSDTIKKITDKTLNLLRKMKPWIHSRLVWMSNSSFMVKGNGFIISILGILLSLPLPIPLSNLSAAWSICLISIGIIEDDGLFIIIGYSVFLLTIAFFLLMWLFTTKNIF
jgi:hypothetical protein